MEYHSIIKRNKIPIHAITWMNPENKLGDISQTEKDKYHMIPLL